MVNKYSSLENFFMTHLEHYNMDMILRAIKFRTNWAMKKIDNNTSNLDFLSGITIGEQSVRFSMLDDSRLATDVFMVDLQDVQQDLYRVDGIVKEWKVSSNANNQMLTYLIRRVLLEGLDTKYIEELYSIMAYRMITSLISNTFKYPLDPRIASVLKEKMSNKFIVKELGSWQKYFNYRASFLFPGTDHAKRLTTEYNSEASIRVINDLQTNLRSTFYRIMALIVEISEGDISIDNTTITSVADGEVIIKDMKNHMSKYTTVAIEALHSNDFVNDNYIYLLGSISPNLNQSVFKSVLTSIHQSSLDNFESLDELVRDIIKYSISYLVRIGEVESLSTNVIEVLRKIKSFYSGSKVTDENILSVKQRTMELVVANTTVKTSWLLTSININVILYIVLLSLVKGR